MFLFVFVLGICVGSFLNVLIYRLPQGLPLTGRSFCPRCRHELAWRDNIPLLSFAFFGGKCRYCQKPISWQYPAVEIATAIVFCIGYLVFSMREDWGIWGFLYYSFISSALIVIFVSDLKYQIIPDQIIIFSVFSTCVYFLYLYPILYTIYHILVGLGTSCFFLSIYLLTKGPR